MPVHCATAHPWIDFLDLSFGFSTRWLQTGRLDIKPFKKPTSLWRPLSCFSMHHPQVHCSWPLAHMGRFSQLSTSTSNLRIFLNAYVCEFMRCCPDHPLLPAMRRLASTAITVNRIRIRAPRPREDCSWLVLPFFPGFMRSSLPRILYEVHSEFLARGASVPKCVSLGALDLCISVRP